MLPFLFIVILLIGTSNCKVDFCEENQLPIVEPLQFTKELSVWEYSVDSKFKSLHCCARGYLSIEWFKDGRPYPWPGDVSSFIIYPESANQTVYTKNIRTSDAGNYTCRIHNDTLLMMHNTELKVFDSSGYMESPLATYRPPDVSTAIVGQMARLYCEAFVGYIDLPDATSEVTWTKEGNDTLNSPRITVKRVQREQIVGEFLMIENVNWSDFGTYVCTISNTGDQKIVMSTQLRELSEWARPLCFGGRVTFFLGGLILTFIIIIIFNLIRIMKKDPPSPLWIKFVEMKRIFPWNNKIKENSLVLIYSDGDQEFVDNTFIPLLNQQSNLYVLPQKINKQGKITDDLRNLCRKNEKNIILMSRHLTDTWTRESVNNVLDGIISCNHTSYCIVLLEPLPEDQFDESCAYLRRPQNKYILSVWDEEMVKNGHPFWAKKNFINLTQPDLRVLSSSIVVTAAAPFRHSFVRLSRSSQSSSSEVPV